MDCCPKIENSDSDKCPVTPVILAGQSYQQYGHQS